MDRSEAVKMLCELVSHVGREVFKNELEHDCFCSNPQAPAFVSVHPEVVAFIVNAVFVAIARDRKASDGPEVAIIARVRQ